MYDVDTDEKNDTLMMPTFSTKVNSAN
jgi:YesN/AraC family two-component response regulator